MDASAIPFSILFIEELGDGDPLSIFRNVSPIKTSVMSCFLALQEKVFQYTYNNRLLIGESGREIGTPGPWERHFVFPQ